MGDARTEAARGGAGNGARIGGAGVERKRYSLRRRLLAMDLHAFRVERGRKTENLLKEDHRDLKRFFALDQSAYRDGALPGRTKELLGMVASAVLRCNDCIVYHLDRCVEEGWTREELLDALNVALVVGGSITIPHIRTCWETVDQLFEEKEAGSRPGR